LDSVSIELEDDKEDKPVVALDVQEQEIKSHWIKDTCTYVESPGDFQYFGCPVEGVNDDQVDAIGFWNPCRYDSCALEFYSGHGIHPRSIALRSYLSGSAEVRISSKLNPKSGDDHVYKVLNAGDSTDGWVDTVVDLDDFPQNAVRFNL